MSDLFSTKSTSDLFSTKGLIPGISGYVSAPCTYTVDYANGSQTYTEKFAVINISAQYTGGASKQIDVIIAEVSAALASAAGAATGGLGLALGPLASVALHWIKDQVFNPDGSVTLMLAYHSIGTKNVGIDPTFWPGGLDPNFWYGIVNSVSTALSLFGSKYDNVGGLEVQSALKAAGNIPSQPEPGISILKKFYSEHHQTLKGMQTTDQQGISREDLVRLGIPILNDDTQFQQFLKEAAAPIQQRSTDEEIDTRSISCMSCKTVAYTVAGGMVLMGGVAVAELTAGSAIVITLAQGLGISNTVALGYIVAAIGTIVFGATAVVQELCGAAGYC